MMPPYFSLVVPTIGRCTEVDALLESIDRSIFRDFEVVIVDQNRDDRLDPVVARFHGRFPLRHMKIEGKGAARARNLGAATVSGSILNFPDDDCEFFPNLLTEAHELIETRRLAVLSGICVDRHDGISTTFFKEGECALTPWTMWGRNAEATMFFDRKLFGEAGGFDARFGVGSRYGSDEGAELLLRLVEDLDPERAWYTDKLRFYHPNKTLDFDDGAIQRSFGYARGSGALLAKWPTLPVIAYSFRLVSRACIGALLFSGPKRRYYWARVRGFISGWREFQGEGRRSR